MMDSVGAGPEAIGALALDAEPDCSALAVGVAACVYVRKSCEIRNVKACGEMRAACSWSNSTNQAPWQWCLLPWL